MNLSNDYNKFCKQNLDFSLFILSVVEFMLTDLLQKLCFSFPFLLHALQNVKKQLLYFMNFWIFSVKS